MTAPKKLTLPTFHGGFLVKVLYLSLDPYMKGRMIPSYTHFVQEFKLGEPLENFGISAVIRTETSNLKVGDHIIGMHPFEHFVVFPADAAHGMRVLNNEECLPWSVYLGIAGIPGQTGWQGMQEFSHWKEGESIFVSSGASAVGQQVIVCQLSKSFGLKVIASAGSEDKVEFLRDACKVDHSFNYKASSVTDELKKFGGIDIYWDNVGGPTLEAAIDALRVHGRVIFCGLSSQYFKEPYGIKNLGKTVGFVVNADGLGEKYNDDFHAQVPKMIRNGELQYKEEIVDGLEFGGHGLLRLLIGESTGKVVIKVQEE